MSIITIIILAVGLGVDAFSVAIGIGAVNDKKSWAPVLRLAAAFGIFQFVMPIVGWLAGLTVVEAEGLAAQFLPHAKSQHLFELQKRSYDAPEAPQVEDAVDAARYEGDFVGRFREKVAHPFGERCFYA